MTKKICVVAPASAVEEVVEYEKLGVSEIYLGFLDYEKNLQNIINKRAKASANFNSIEELKKVRTIFSGQISFTLNAPFFNTSQLAELKIQIKQTKELVDNYIVADVSIINLVKNLAPEKGIIISCIATTLNSDTAKFYHSLGAKKIILPRHLTLTEIKQIVKNNSEIKFEVMILNQFCRNIDGFCSRCHIMEGEQVITNCNIPFSYKLMSLNNTKINELAKVNLGSYLKFNPKCGLCFIKELEKVGVDSLKIVGRGNDLKKKREDVKLVQEVINATKLEEKEFQTFCKTIFVKNFGVACHNNCYY